MELKINLDPQLEYIVHTAGESQYGMELHPQNFWSGRKFDLEKIEAIREPGIRALNRADVMRHLEHGRSEIYWIKNEGRRLEVHCDNARKLIEQKLRNSFVYRATPRQEVEHASVPFVEEDELVLAGTKEEDDEMLDDEEYAERRARSRTPEPGEMSRYDDDYELDEDTVNSDEVEQDQAMSDEDENKENGEDEGRVKEESGRNDSVVAGSWGGLTIRAQSPDL